MKDFYSDEQRAMLYREVRRCLVLKEKYAPVVMSAGEFAEWQKSHGNYFLHRGYLSIWEGIEVPVGVDEVVIEKKRVRDAVKPYLIFGDVRAFEEYCRNARLLGAGVFELLRKDFMDKMYTKAEEYGVPASACDDMQAELEKFVGLNFRADASALPDEQLYGSLFKYCKRGLEQKAESIFKRYGVIIHVDIEEWDSFLSMEKLTAGVDTSCAGSDEDKINPERLLMKVLDLMDKLENKKGSKFDMKDNLLRQVVSSGCATDEFISGYYASLKERRSIWCPVAFSYQVHFAHKNGMEYLKNPAFIRTCGNMSVGEMIEDQLSTYKEENINERALSGMYSVRNRVYDENIQAVTLLACAGNSEQIGKALSKELRTEEARGSLARALLVSALERTREACPEDVKGEDYHE